MIAVLTTLEHFLNAGGRWRHYRSTVERLKSEGWAYLSLATPYATAGDHDAGFPTFVDQVEAMIRADVGHYVTIVDTDTAAKTRPAA